MIKVILFDFDGTIADSFENFLKIIKEISEKYSLPDLSESELNELRNYDARSVIKKLNIPFFKIPFIALDMKRHQHKDVGDLNTFNGLHKVLKDLKSKGFSLGIITSNGKENVVKFLKSNNIEEFNYISGDTSLFGKDRAIKNFITKFKLKKEEVVYVGDEIRDIVACKKVNVRVISVTWGFNTRKGLMKHSPDYVVDSPQELLNAIDVISN